MANCIVVDDDQDSLDMFCELLDLLGVNVIARGKKGKEAEKLYKKHQPNVIFVDLIMPKYDGFLQLRELCVWTQMPRL